MDKLMVSLMTFWNDITGKNEKEKGATGTEYAILVSFIALLIIVGVTAFGTQLGAWFEGLAAQVTN